MPREEVPNPKKRRRDRDALSVGDPVAPAPPAVDPFLGANYRDLLYAKPILSDREKQRALHLIGELSRRQCEGLKLFEPLPQQDRFLSSRSRQRIARGGNRSGKTLVAAVEVARALCGSDPFHKYPLEEGRAIVVGKDLEHIGQTMWRKLSRAGAFKMIKDERTKLWRAYRPGDPYDDSYAEKAKSAPPLIPPRMIKDISWESKKGGIPRKVMMRNGWEATFYSSKGEPPQGMDVDLCLAGWSEVFDPVQNRMRRVDSIDGPWHVLSWNEATRGFEVRPASRPFIKSYGEMCRAETSGGGVLFTTRHHRVLAADGRWLSVQEAWEEGVALRAAHLAALGFPAAGVPAGPRPARSGRRGRVARLSSGGRGRRLLRSGGRASPSRTTSPGCGAADAPPGIRGLEGSRGSCSPCSRPCGGRLPSGQGVAQGSTPSRPDARERSLANCGADGLADGSGCIPPDRESGCDTVAYASARSCGSASPLIAGTAARPYIPSSSRRRFPRSSAVRQRTSCGSPRCRSGSSSVFQGGGPESLPPPANGERSGSTCGSAVSANPYPGPPRRRVAEGSPLLATGDIGCGAGGSRALASIRSGDEFPPEYITKLETVSESPIWDISVPGTYNYVYAGTVSHNSWFDEEIVHHDWLPETLARLIDRSGFLVWSATPQAGTQQLYDLHCRAEELALDEPELNKPRQVEESFLSIYDNRHISDQARTEFIDSLSEEERRVRVDGEFAITGLKIFEGYFFPSGVHGVDPFPIPHGWTRYAAVDPGAQVCAVLFGAVPPMTPDSTDLDPTLFGDFLYLYDELYIKRCDAVLFGRRMKDQVGDQSMYQFLIDHHGGRLTDVGSGKTPEQQYSDALKANGVKCLRTGHKFTWGSDDVAGRILKAKEWMHVRENGTAKIRVLKGRCPNLVKEMARYQWKKQGDVITDIPLKKNDHLCDTLGYLVMCNPRYVKAKPGDLPKSYAVRAVEAIKAREKSRRRAAGMTGVVLA